jgi:hypothetical protein
MYSIVGLSSGPLYEIIENYRPQTLLCVVTAIGGLLAALQGLHSFPFGMQPINVQAACL